MASWASHGLAGSPGRLDEMQQAAPTTTSDLVALEWYATVLGRVTSVSVADLAGNGRPQVLCGAVPATLGVEAPYWYVLDPWNGFSHDWAGAPRLAILAVANIDSDPAAELFVGGDPGYGGGELFVYDGASRALEKTIAVDPSTRLVSVGDLDADGTLEIVVSSREAGLQVFDAASAALEYQDGSRGPFAAVANVDDDPALELIFGTGQVVDGGTRAVEWSSPLPFAGIVRAADLNGDRAAEVVVLHADYDTNEVRIFDVKQHAWIATIPAGPFGIKAMALLDVEGDGWAEIVLGDGEGKVHVLDGVSRLEKWSVSVPEWGITDVAIGNLDGDGSLELVIAASGGDHNGALYLIDVSTRSIQWRSPGHTGPFRAFAEGDVDADGRRELVVGNGGTDSGTREGVWTVFDPSTHIEEYESQSSGSVWQGTSLVRRIRVANVDADPQLEVFVTRIEGQSSFVECVDGKTHARQWRAPLRAEGLAIGDLERDGSLELVASNSVLVVIFDAATGAVKWQTNAASNYAHDGSILRLANVDADPQLEIVVAGLESGVAVIDGVTGAALTMPYSGVTALDTADRDGDGIDEIIVGRSHGSVSVLTLDGSPGEVVATGFVDLCGLAVADLDGIPGLEYVVGSRWRVDILNPTGTRWRDDIVGIDQPGASDGILVGDIDSDSPRRGGDRGRALRLPRV